jgi:hypothetical protein
MRCRIGRTATLASGTGSRYSQAVPDPTHHEGASMHSITTIERAERNTAASLIFGTPASVTSGIVAEVEADGLTLGCSRLDGEDRWTIDSIWRGSFPVFANGTFSRCTILRHPAPAIAAALDEAARSVA